MIEFPELPARRRRTFARAHAWRAAALVGVLLWPAAAEPGEATVPPPYVPVRLQPGEGEESTGLRVTVWGRSYRFARGPAPVSIVSQGSELLQGPLHFDLHIGGSPAPIAWQAPALVAGTPEALQLSTRGTAGALEITAATHVEYDGMIRIDLSFRARREGRIDRFAYELPIRDQVAWIFNHHVPYDYSALNIDKQEMLSAAGAFPEAGRPKRLAFVPTLFIGNREVGLEWWSDSDAFWTGSPEDRPLEIGRRAGAAYLRVEPIRAPLELAAGESWSDSFALFPAPFRPTPPSWRAVRFTTQWRRPARPPRLHLRRVWIPFPNHFDALWHGLPTSRDSHGQRQLRAKLRENDVDYVPYGYLTVVPTLHPVAMAKAEEWAANDQRYVGPPKGLRHFLEQRTDWKPRQPYGYAACMAREDYVDWMLDQYVQTFQKENLDGLYFDHAAISRLCLNSPLLENRPGRQIWGYFNVRRFYKRLFEAMQAQDPDSLLVIHTHGPPRALAAWADFVIIGEAWNVLFRDGHRFPAIAKDPTLYDPDYFRLPVDYLEAQLLPRLGGITTILPEVKYAIDPDAPKRAQRLQRAFFARILPFDVPIWHGNSEPTVLHSVFDALDRFGSLDGASVHPWWDGRGAQADEDGVRVTAYAIRGRVLLLIANWGDEAVDARLRLDRKALGLPARFRVRDGEEGRQVHPVSDEGTLRVKIPARDLRILVAE